MEEIKINGEAINLIFYECGGVEEAYKFKIGETYDWELDDETLSTIKELDEYKDWYIYCIHNVYNDRIDHDGSTFESQVILEAPDGSKYMAETSMSLFTGWNFDEDLELELIENKTILDYDEDIRI